MKHKKTILTEEQLRKIVKEVIEKYLKKISKPKFNGRIEGVHFNIDEHFALIKNRWDYPKFINEGLISTYPSERVRNVILRKFGLMDEQVEIRRISANEGDVDLITIIIPKNSTKDYIGDITHEMETCGYFRSQEMQPYCGGNVYGVLVFEPKYSNNISTKIRESCHYLYHCTDSVNINKILKKGLIPRSNNALFMFPDRIYAFKGDVLTQEQIEIMYQIQMKHNEDISGTKNPIEKLEYYLLTIDINKIPQDVKLYSDPLSKGAVFTNDNIPPSAIVDVQPFTLRRQY